MNTKQIEYVITIAEEKNMQKAANRLFITQSALSQSLLKLEDDLGCPLFVRQPREMIPTEAGLLYIEGGKKILNIKAETYNRISFLTTKKGNHYRIGISSHDGIERFLEASAILKTKHPGVDVYAIEDTFKNLLERLKKHDVSLIIVSWNNPEEITFPHQVIQEEEIILLAKKNALNGLAEDEHSVSLELLKEKSFVLTPAGSTLRNITDIAFNRTNYIPHVICELNNIPATLNMVFSQDSLAFLPLCLCKKYLNNDEFKNDISIYHLKPELYRYQLIAYNEEAEENTILRDLIRILTEESNDNQM